MARRLTDPRLRALIRVKCRRCQRPTAEGTGAMEEAPDVNEWLIEFSCESCGETDLAWIDQMLDPNVLTIDLGTSRLAQGSSAMTALVDVAPWHGEAAPVRAFDPPALSPA
mgnify:CR=1 FL=1